MTRRGVPVPALIKELSEPDRQRHRCGRFNCICGGEFTARISDVWYGRVKSCGCYRQRRRRIREGEQH
jgi:hypothetical protein